MGSSHRYKSCNRAGTSVLQALGMNRGVSANGAELRTPTVTLESNTEKAFRSYKEKRADNTLGSYSPVELGGVDVANAVLERCPQQHEVRWYLFAVLQSHDLAHLACDLVRQSDTIMTPW